MVKVTVVGRFWDRQAHVNRFPGDVFEATEDRAKEIDSLIPGYITFSDVESEDLSVSDVESEDLSALKVADLRSIAKERGVKLPAGANKSEIIKLIEG